MLLLLLPPLSLVTGGESTSADTTGLSEDDRLQEERGIRDGRCELLQRQMQLGRRHRRVQSPLLLLLLLCVPTLLQQLRVDEARCTTTTVLEEEEDNDEQATNAMVNRLDLSTATAAQSRHPTQACECTTPPPGRLNQVARQG